MACAPAVACRRTALEFAGKESTRQRALIGSGAASELVAERAELQERTSREELQSAEFGARVAEHDLQMAQAAERRGGAARGALARDR
jgi:hypothetical protein